MLEYENILEANHSFLDSFGVLFLAASESTLARMCPEVKVPGFPSAIKYLSVKVPPIAHSQQSHDSYTTAASARLLHGGEMNTQKNLFDTDVVFFYFMHEHCSFDFR